MLALDVVNASAGYGLPMETLWEIVLYIQILFNWLIVPVFMSYYESNLTANTVSSSNSRGSASSPP